MKLNIEAALSYEFAAPTDMLMQVEVARMAGQEIVSDGLWTTPVEDFSRISAESALGTRAWMRAEGRLDVTYRAEIDVIRPDWNISALPAVAPRFLNAEATSFLMPSRYCPSDQFQSFAGAEFDGLFGGALIMAMRDWIEETFEYVAGVSTSATTARDTFLQRQGVCRDYAHVMIAMSRAMGVPARFASVYAPFVDPPDFHAVAEVWLDGAWHLVDPTGMATPSQIAIVGIGRDAAEVSFLTTFGPAVLVSQKVMVTEA
ncbi:Transglutaminase-like superfamily protein [Jannaschia seosinensis]|uniref:Transglutaminase-like superfamily protein n=1 Tax=Jannaschia seosinensis TaxID=313367 RepID=A0A0M7BAH6_9RHOB|nr:transglutaminase family protein [Jannaschia seosinensis]CUH39740.1 Transglutaminase-like superfamily protein [Jannaschia seosinensis]